MLQILAAESCVELPKQPTRRQRSVAPAGTFSRRTDPPEQLYTKLSELGDPVIRPVRQGDRRGNTLWKEFVQRYHYLGYRLPVGAQIRYFVYSRSRPHSILACLLWSSPAWHVSARDSWIGWSDEQRQRKLQLVVNNSRFLVLPWSRVHGLASKILSDCVRRLPKDWRKRYGYEPVLLETFVESRRFRGTCYAAAGWVLVGNTVGRGRSDSTHKGPKLSTKYVFVRPLSANAKEILLSW